MSLGAFDEVTAFEAAAWFGSRIYAEREQRSVDIEKRQRAPSVIGHGPHGSGRSPRDIGSL